MGCLEINSRRMFGVKVIKSRAGFVGIWYMSGWNVFWKHKRTYCAYTCNSVCVCPYTCICQGSLLHNIIALKTAVRIHVQFLQLLFLFTSSWGGFFWSKNLILSRISIGLLGSTAVYIYLWTVHTLFIKLCVFHKYWMEKQTLFQNGTTYLQVNKVQLTRRSACYRFELSNFASQV